MLLTFEQVDAAMGLPIGSIARKAATKNPGDLMIIGNKRYMLASSTAVQEIVPVKSAAASAARVEADAAKELLDMIHDEIRVLGVQPCLYGKDGVISPMSNYEWELYAASKLRGTTTYAAAVTASKHVVSFMTNDERARFAIAPEQIEPVLFANAPRQPCWARIQVDDTPLYEVPEAFAQFLARIETQGQRDSLIRWVGSVLDTKSDRSEYLYLHGDGNDGKSTFIEVLNKIMDPASTVMSTDILKNDHGSTALEGKRLVIFNEENSASFAKSATLKRLTGDDAHLINPKNAALRKALLQCKVIYVSNFEPSIHGLKADTRRLAYVVIKPFENSKGGLDTSFKVRLMQQAPDMLRYCWTKYLEWRAQNPTGGKLGDPEALASIMEESTVSQAEDLFQQHFTFTGNDSDFMLVTDALNRVDTICKGDFSLRAAVKKVIRAKCGKAEVKYFKEANKSFRCYMKLALANPLRPGDAPVNPVLT